MQIAALPRITAPPRFHRVPDLLQENLPSHFLGFWPRCSHFNHVPEEEEPTLSDQQGAVFVCCKIGEGEKMVVDVHVLLILLGPKNKSDLVWL